MEENSMFKCELCGRMSKPKERCVKVVTRKREKNYFRPPNRDEEFPQLIGKGWESSDLAEQGSGRYIAKVPEPEKGWTAFFVELSYPSESGFLHKFTTEVHVVPDRLPFAK